MMNDPIERRRRTRQPLQRELRYRRLDRSGAIGCGTTMNISNHALAFQVAGPLPVGTRVEVSVSWPSESGSTLRLRATGVVVRCDGRVVACTMEDAVFRAEEIGEDGEVAAFAPDVGRAA